MRFGPEPDEVKRMLRMAEMRILAAAASVTRIEVKDDVARIYLRSGEPYLLKNGKLPRISGKTPDAKLTSLFRVLGGLAAK